MGQVVKLTPVKNANGGGAPPLVIKSKATTDLINIEKEYKHFRRFLKSAKKTGASIDLEELKWMRKNVRRLIPIAATVFATYKNDRAAVALNILMNQQREIINDLRSVDSGPKQLQHIMQVILTPLLQSVMQNYMSQTSELKQQCQKITSSKQKKIMLKSLNKALESQGQFFNMLQQGLESKLSDYLIGKP